RRVVPSSASNHPPFSALGSLRVPDVAAGEAFGEPIRYPLRSIAGKILHTVRTATGLVTTRRREPSFVRTLRGLTEVRTQRGRLVITPGICPSIRATRCCFPFRLCRQAPASPLAVCIGVVPIHPDHRHLIGPGEARLPPKIRRSKPARCFQNSHIAPHRPPH